MAHLGTSTQVALALFIFGGFCLSALDAVGKLVISESGLLLLLWARYVGQVLISVPIAYYCAGKTFWRSARPRLQIFRSILLGLTSIFFFAGIQWLPLAEASAISFTAPIFVALLSGPILGSGSKRTIYGLRQLDFLGSY